MQLDRTSIAIRERDLFDVLDLALHVIRHFGSPLLLWFAAGAIPFAILNALLLSSVADNTNFELDAPAEYVSLMVMLLVWEIPLATAPLTLCLGQAMFEQKIDHRRVFKDLLGSLPQLILLQGIGRGLLIPLVITWLLPFVAWPYLNEIILLERNPLFKRRGGMGTFRRSTALHSGAGGDSFGRWLSCMLLAAGLTIAVWLSIWFLRMMLATEATFDRPMYTVWLPVAMWLVIFYFAIVRFLGYLDLRIRREGWELDLRVRAEAARVARQVT